MPALDKRDTSGLEVICVLYAQVNGFRDIFSRRDAKVSNIYQGHLVVDIVVIVHLEVLDALHSSTLHDVGGHLVHLVSVGLRFRIPHLCAQRFQIYYT